MLDQLCIWAPIYHCADSSTRMNSPLLTLQSSLTNIKNVTVIVSIIPYLYTELLISAAWLRCNQTSNCYYDHFQMLVVLNQIHIREKIESWIAPTYNLGTDHDGTEIECNPIWKFPSWLLFLEFVIFIKFILHLLTA